MTLNIKTVFFTDVIPANKLKCFLGYSRFADA